MIKQIIAVAKAGFEAISSAVWLGVALLIFNSYAKQMEFITPFNYIDKWVISCAFVSFLYYGIININNIKEKSSPSHTKEDKA